MDIFVSLPAQTLELYDGAQLAARYRISSAERGAGEENGSFMTPRGRHLIRAKIGGGCPENAVFVGRRPTGELWTPQLAACHPGRDWMVSRILWLSGLEPGRNRLGAVDTMRRYIYLHGAPDIVSLGEPGSHGCLRMGNLDIIDLFDRVAAYTLVNIGDFRIATGRDSPERLEVQALDSAGSPVARCLADRLGLINSIEVDAAWRGKGVAKQLLRSLIALATMSGLERLTLAAPGQLAAAWLGLGFTPLASTPGGAMQLKLGMARS